jgi:hypothetical protein
MIITSDIHPFMTESGETVKKSPVSMRACMREWRSRMTERDRVGKIHVGKKVHREKTNRKSTMFVMR